MALLAAGRAVAGHAASAIESHAKAVRPQPKRLVVVPGRHPLMAGVAALRLVVAELATIRARDVAGRRAALPAVPHDVTVPTQPGPGVGRWQPIPVDGAVAFATVVAHTGALVAFHACRFLDERRERHGILGRCLDMTRLTGDPVLGDVRQMREDDVRGALRIRHGTVATVGAEERADPAVDRFALVDAVVARSTELGRWQPRIVADQSTAVTERTGQAVALDVHPMRERGLAPGRSTQRKASGRDDPAREASRDENTPRHSASAVRFS